MYYLIPSDKFCLIQSTLVYVTYNENYLLTYHAVIWPYIRRNNCEKSIPTIWNCFQVEKLYNDFSEGWLNYCMMWLFQKIRAICMLSLIFLWTFLKMYWIDHYFSHIENSLLLRNDVLHKLHYFSFHLPQHQIQCFKKHFLLGSRIVWS